MYTIFINDAVIYLTDNYALHTNKNFLIYKKVKLDSLLEKIENTALQSVYLYDQDLEFLWRDFKNNFDIIEAAGGVVSNEHNAILWIFRNDRWDLPKGKIEKGESKEIAAIREVEEECGISGVVLKQYLNTTYHLYAFKKKRVLKVTYWYSMFAEDQFVTPQVEEGITKVVWLNEDAMKKAFENTYGNIKLLFKDTT